MSHFQLLTCAAAASLLMGCASAPAVREAVNPQDRAQRSITNFSPALRCMDGLLFNAGVRDLTMVMDDMRDATQKVPVGARDMMTSAVSEMTRRSRAVRLSLIGGGGEDVYKRQMYSSQWLAVVGFLPTIYTQAGVPGPVLSLIHIS